MVLTMRRVMSASAVGAMMHRATSARVAVPMMLRVISVSHAEPMMRLDMFAKGAVLTMRLGISVAAVVPMMLPVTTARTRAADFIPNPRGSRTGFGGGDRRSPFSGLRGGFH